MRFGIGAKIILLLIAVVALTAAVLGYSLLKTTSELVLDHELVDLSDETSNAAHEMSSYLYRIRSGMQKISGEKGLEQLSAGEADELAASLSDICPKFYEKSLENYLRLEVWLKDGPKLERLNVLKEELQRAQLVDENQPTSTFGHFRSVLKQLTEPLKSRELFISDIGTVKISQRLDNKPSSKPSPNVTRIVNSMWCGFRVEKPGSSRKLYVAVLVDLDAPLLKSDETGDAPDSLDHSRLLKEEESPFMAIRSSPRFLNIMANCRHAGGEDSTRKEHHHDFSLTFLDDTKSYYPDIEILRETFGELYDEQPHADNELSSPIVMFKRDDKKTPNIELTKQLVYLQSAPIPHPKLRREFAARIKKIQRDRVGQFERTRIAINGADEYFVQLRADSDESMQLAVKEVNRIAKEVSEDIRISWRDSVKCKTCAPCFVLYRIRSAGASEHGSFRYFGLARSVFLEEMQADVKNELSTARNAALAIVGIVSLLGFGTSLYLTRPLKKITLAAEAVGRTNFESEHEHLEQDIGAISRMLPVHRSDEIGVLARSFDQMIREMLAGQVRLHRLNTDLDRRVTERTDELQQANEKLKTARDKTEELSRAKDAFLASVSHELRNPLNQVSGFCQLLELTDLNEVQMADLRKIKQAGSQLLALINDILDYQKIVMGGITLEPEQVEVSELLDEVRDGLKFPNEENRNELIVDWSEGVGAIYADKQRLRQVLLNLAGNASKFTGNGRVHVHARRVPGDDGNDDIEFSIADTGRGMTPEEQMKLFTPFTKLASKQGNRTGTGLGLVISKGLSESMGGSISMWSEFGKGSTFTVRLPAFSSESVSASYDKNSFAALTGGQPVDSKKAAGSTMTERKPSDRFVDENNDSWTIELLSSRAQSKQQRTILVIDDDPDVREVMSRYLTSEGFEIETAADGVKGLEMARNLLPAAITLDVSMPGLDGWAVLAALKTDHVLADIPVIMVTMVDNPPRGQIMGADEFVVKPIDWARLSRILARHMTPDGNQSILIVDDDDGARELLRRNVETDGWSVLEAENGKEALEVLSFNTPAAILLDLMMPVMDGFEFLERRSVDQRCIPVIVVTAKDPTPQEFATLNGRVARVLPKGQYSQEQLLQEIHRWVEQHVAPAAKAHEGGAHA